MLRPRLGLDWRPRRPRKEVRGLAPPNSSAAMLLRTISARSYHLLATRICPVMASTGTTTPTSKRERSATPPVPSSKSTSKPPASSAAASIDETPDVKKLKVDDNTPVASLPSSSNAVEASSDVKPGGALAAETPEARGEASTEAGPSTTRTYYTGPAVPRPADPNSNKSKKRAKAAAAGGQGGRGRKAYQGKGRERNEQDAAARQSGSTWGPAREGGGEKADRLPKKKTAVLIGFSGTGYNGMQMWVFRMLAT